MTLKRMVVLFILILDVAAFPFACPRKYNESVCVSREDINNIYYTDASGNEKAVYFPLISRALYLEDGYVKLNEDITLEETILDYTTVDEEGNPVSRTYRIVKWYKVDSKHNVDESTEITFPYKTSSSDFLTYYYGRRNVVVFVPVIEEINK